MHTFLQMYRNINTLILLIHIIIHYLFVLFICVLLLHLQYTYVIYVSIVLLFVMIYRLLYHMHSYTPITNILIYTYSLLQTPTF